MTNRFFGPAFTILNHRKTRLWFRLNKHRIVLLAIFGCLIIWFILKNVPETKAPVPAPKVIITPTPEPKWIKTPEGGEYREDICEQFAVLEVTINGKTQKICPKPEKSEPRTEPNAPEGPITGKASYYSVAGCLGCRDDRRMANGEILDDTKLTIAYNHARLGTIVTITNQKSGKVVQAKVTDRGGFERHGKIADLSLATKNALECGDVCEISLKI